MNNIFHRPWKSSTYVILLLGLTLLLGSYELMRYSGLIGETDTVTFTRVIANMMDSGKLIPASGLVYQNGYGYQVLIAWLVDFTHLPLGVVQTVGGALLVTWVIVPAWLAYREFTQSELAASLGCLVLLVQPDFLFPLLRGTHEKFTRGLMFLCMFLLIRSLRVRTIRLAIAFIFCFYISAYTLVAFNTFYSFSFILAIILSLGMVWLVGKRVPGNDTSKTPLIPKLIYVSISMLVIAFIFMLYAYPPAESQLLLLRSVWDRVALLTLQVEQTASNPYQVVVEGWISMPVYYLVSLANWVLLGLSLFIWFRQSYIWFIKRVTSPAWYELLLWSFYTAFAFLGFVSIIVDVSGALAANFQHRSFPSFAMLAAPMVGAWLSGKKFSSTSGSKLTWAGISVVLGGLMILSIFKATNEPLLSNYWSFYTPAEYQAVSWGERYLQQRSLWIGWWGQVGAGYITRANGEAIKLELDGSAPSDYTRDYLISPEIRLYASRIESQLPIQADDYITYDNGDTQVYHRRPLTPFQK